MFEKIKKSDLKSVESIDDFIKKYEKSMGRKLFASNMLLIACVTYLMTSAFMMKFLGGPNVAYGISFALVSVALLLRNSYSFDWASLQAFSTSTRLEVIENVADIEYTSDSCMFQGKPIDKARIERLKKAIREANNEA